MDTYYILISFNTMNFLKERVLHLLNFIVIYAFTWRTLLSPNQVYMQYALFQNLTQCV